MLSCVIFPSPQNEIDPGPEAEELMSYGRARAMCYSFLTSRLSLLPLRRGKRMNIKIQEGDVEIRNRRKLIRV